MSAVLRGLVLAGGHSRRMHRDKAALPYQGKPQLERAVELLSAAVGKCAVSIRADQLNDPLRTRFDTVVDIQPDLGPIGGILSAQHQDADAAWLVLACDLPFLNADTLQHLIAQRNPERIATAYRSAFDGKPEPLCAIWEPHSAAAVRAWIDAGQRCPRALLTSSDAQLLDLPSAQALDNINTAEEYARAQPARRVRVRYFALLREQAGVGMEEVESSAPSLAALYGELQQRRHLTPPIDTLRVAVNEQFADWSAPFQTGETIAFLPPVAGG